MQAHVKSTDEGVLDVKKAMTVHDEMIKAVAADMEQLQQVTILLIVDC